MYQIAICDDDETFCWRTEEYIKTYCKKHNLKAETQVFNSGITLLEYIERERPFDLLLLDIEMDGLNGVSVGQKLRHKLENEITQIVYVSIKSSYAMELFKVRPMDVLIKPITMDDITHIMDIYCRLFAHSINYFEFKNGKSTCKLDQQHIICLQSKGKVVHINTIHGTEIFYGKLSDALEQLNSENFYCVHKSFIINWNYVAEYRFDKILLSNGEIIPISQSKRSSVRQHILQNNMKNTPT